MERKTSEITPFPRITRHYVPTPPPRPSQWLFIAFSTLSGIFAKCSAFLQEMAASNPTCDDSTLTSQPTTRASFSTYLFTAYALSSPPTNSWSFHSLSPKLLSIDSSSYPASYHQHRILLPQTRQQTSDHLTYTYTSSPFSCISTQ